MLVCNINKKIIPGDYSIINIVKSLYNTPGNASNVFKNRGKIFWLSTSAASVGPLAQSAERGADNANVVSSTLTLTTTIYF